MREHDQNFLVKFVTDNLWSILIAISTIIFITATYGVRLSAAEAKISQYPSQDWFELKFKNIDENIDEVKKNLKEHEVLTQKFINNESK